MKTIAAITGLLAIFFASPGAFCLAQDTEKVPVAVLAETVHKLDNVIEGTIVTHDFILKNQGTADLIIKEIKSG